MTIFDLGCATWDCVGVVPLLWGPAHAVAYSLALGVGIALGRRHG